MPYYYDIVTHYVAFVKLWYIMEHYGTSWHIMKHYLKLWYIMEVQEPNR